LLLGARHFNDFRLSIPLIPPATLSKRLKSLQDTGVIERIESSDRGSWEYRLTDSGMALKPFLDFGGKWLDLLKQMVPDLRRAAVMFNPEIAPQSKLFFEAVEAAGQSMGVEVKAAPLHAAGDIEPAMARVAKQSSAGLDFPPDNFTNTHHSMIAQVAAQYRLPCLSLENDLHH
jgi:DNA-binding HxlR family transcriptional regulator